MIPLSNTTTYKILVLKGIDLAIIMMPVESLSVWQPDSNPSMKCKQETFKGLRQSPAKKSCSGLISPMLSIIFWGSGKNFYFFFVVVVVFQASTGKKLQGKRSRKKYWDQEFDAKHSATDKNILVIFLQVVIYLA